MTLSVFRSWTGLAQFALEPYIEGMRPPLQTLIDILYLNQDETRVRDNHINLLPRYQTEWLHFKVQLLKLFSDCLQLRQPKNFDSYTEALATIEPSYFREHWKLAEGFVASEANDILPHLAKTRPNLQECHKSLLILCLLRANLPKALVNVMTTTQKPEISIRATLLLGQFLHAANVYLPRDLNGSSHCLPTLLDEVSSTDVHQANRASEAVAALQKLHTMKKKGPQPCSLFLENIMGN